jgi:3',5'-cyclic AMP phosphodiesterase CpdA
MRIVLLGDLHFYQLAVWPWQLLSKRLLGQTNLWLNRRRHFDLSLWPVTREHLLSLKPELLLGSGDFTTTALPSEFNQAFTHLRPLLDEPSLETLLVPGNHDRYTFSSKRQCLFEKALGAWTCDDWPCVRTFGDRMVICLDPTRPNKWNASGLVGQTQRDRLAELLANAPEGKAIIVLCHYPIGTPPDLKPEAYAHGLEDKQALGKVLCDSGRRILMVHGHIHWPWQWDYNDNPNVTTINAGAPMLKCRHYPYGQGFVSLDWAPGEAWPSAITRHVRDANGAWIANSG